MTFLERDVILRMVGRALSPEAMLQQLGEPDGAAFGERLVAEAAAFRDADELAIALIPGFRFGYRVHQLPLLHEPAAADWHRSHEDVIGALAKLRQPESVEVLQRLALAPPDYLDEDDAVAFGKKAIRALAEIAGETADRALQAIAATVTNDEQRDLVERRLRERGVV